MTRHIAAALAGRSSELAERWLDRLRDRVDLRPRSVVPGEVLLECMPPVIEGVAAFLRDDEAEAAPDLTERLRRLVRLRWRQGYHVEELLVELAVLRETLFEELREELGGHEDELSLDAALAIVGRLDDGLSEAMARAVGLYRQEESAAQAEQVRSIAEFNRVLTHELKNPLSAAQAAAQVLEELDPQLPAEKRRSMAAQIRQRLRQANDLLTSVVSLSYVSHRGPTERRAPLAAVVRQAVADVGDFARGRGVAIRLEGKVPEFIVDANRAGLALYNLLANAVKYSDSRKPEAWVRLEVRPADDPGEWRIEVEDNGLGIDPVDQERIFERFFRAHPDREEGHGLGLAIVKEAVEQMGGRIACESHPGRGSRFFFTINDPTSYLDA